MLKSFLMIIHTQSIYEYMLATMNKEARSSLFTETDVWHNQTRRLIAEIKKIQYEFSDVWYISTRRLFLETNVLLFLFWIWIQNQKRLLKILIKTSVSERMHLYGRDTTLYTYFSSSNPFMISYNSLNIINRGFNNCFDH